MLPKGTDRQFITNQEIVRRSPVRSLFNNLSFLLLFSQLWIPPIFATESKQSRRFTSVRGVNCSCLFGCMVTWRLPKVENKHRMVARLFLSSTLQWWRYGYCSFCPPHLWGRRCEVPTIYYYMYARGKKAEKNRIPRHFWTEIKDY